MLFRKLGLTGRRGRLAIGVIVTSLIMMLLGHQSSLQETQHREILALQRRYLHLDDTSEMKEAEIPPMFNSQQENLLAKIREISSYSRKTDMVLGKSLIKNKAPPPEPDEEQKYYAAKIQLGLEQPRQLLPGEVRGKPLESADEKVNGSSLKDADVVAAIERKSNYSQYPPEMPPDRFKFIHDKKRISMNGPVVNPITENLTWRHKLDHIIVCNKTDPFILAIVVSAVSKSKLRNYIRRTWANPKLYPYTKIRSVFIIGATKDTVLQDAVDKEHAQYNDIIQYNYIDSYGNLTHKSLAWLAWVGKYCPQAQFIAKIDDDVMVNPFHLRAYFEEKMKVPPIPRRKPSVETALSPGDNIATSYIYGRYDGEPYPLRNTKWAVTMEEYPEKRYPPFVHGPAYVVGRAAAQLMLKYAPYVPYLKLEDVFTTGLLAHAAQVQHVDIMGVINTFKATSKLYNGTQALMEETNEKSRQEAWEGISLYAPVNITDLGTPWT